jgi:hypothetical protein
MPAWTTSPEKQVSDRELSTVTFPRAKNFWRQFIAPRWKKLAAAEQKFAEQLPPAEALRAWLFLFIDYIAAKQLITPALNALVGEPKKVRAVFGHGEGERLRRAPFGRIWLLPAQGTPRAQGRRTPIGRQFRFWSALTTPLAPGHQQQHHSHSGLSEGMSSSAVLSFTGHFLMAKRASSIAWGIGSRNA